MEGIDDRWRGRDLCNLYRVCWRRVNTAHLSLCVCVCVCVCVSGYFNAVCVRLLCVWVCEYIYVNMFYLLFMYGVTIVRGRRSSIRQLFRRFAVLHLCVCVCVCVLCVWCVCVCVCDDESTFPHLNFACFWLCLKKEKNIFWINKKSCISLIVLSYCPFNSKSLTVSVKIFYKNNLISFWMLLTSLLHFACSNKCVCVCVCVCVCMYERVWPCGSARHVD